MSILEKPSQSRNEKDIDILMSVLKNYKLFRQYMKKKSILEHIPQRSLKCMKVMSIYSPNYIVFDSDETLNPLYIILKG